MLLQIDILRTKGKRRILMLNDLGQPLRSTAAGNHNIYVTVPASCYGQAPVTRTTPSLKVSFIFQLQAIILFRIGSAPLWKSLASTSS
jgi:hypothetical protein